MKEVQAPPTHKMVHERIIIDAFLSDLSISDKPIFAGLTEEGNYNYPDCIVPSKSLAIEETRVLFYKVETIAKNGRGNELLTLRPFNNLTDEAIIDKIKKTIHKKDSKKNYQSLLTYENRVLIVSVDGIFLNWRNQEKIALPSHFSDVKLNIFNSVYLTFYPTIPTKYDIDHKIIPGLTINFYKIIG